MHARGKIPKIPELTAHGIEQKKNNDIATCLGALPIHLIVMHP
jgi:hypothetical protein